MQHKEGEKTCQFQSKSQCLEEEFTDKGDACKKPGIDIRKKKLFETNLQLFVLQMLTAFPCFPREFVKKQRPEVHKFVRKQVISPRIVHQESFCQWLINVCQKPIFKVKTRIEYLT